MWPLPEDLGLYLHDIMHCAATTWPDDWIIAWLRCIGVPNKVVCECIFSILPIKTWGPLNTNTFRIHLRGKKDIWKHCIKLQWIKKYIFGLAKRMNKYRYKKSKHTVWSKCYDKLSIIIYPLQSDYIGDIKQNKNHRNNNYCLFKQVRKYTQQGSWIRCLGIEIGYFLYVFHSDYIHYTNYSA